MKNLHILPTDKPSRLWTNNLRRRIELDEFPEQHPNQIAKHIYITSDEEIKEGDWFYSVRELIEKAIINYPKGEHFGKVILTTNGDLIKDGVQAIDDEFLNWFVKNPSCEFVEIGEGVRYEDEWIDNEDGGEIFQHQYCCYKIIIPKEEPKQETNLKKHLDSCEEYQGPRRSAIVDKQETLEEAAEKYAEIYRCPSTNENEYCKHDIISAFNNGAKWQQERMYSEEEVYDMLVQHTIELFKEQPCTLDEFFEQFKKKISK